MLTRAGQCRYAGVSLSFAHNSYRTATHTVCCGYSLHNLAYGQPQCTSVAVSCTQHVINIFVFAGGGCSLQVQCYRPESRQGEGVECVELDNVLRCV